MLYIAISEGVLIADAQNLSVWRLWEKTGDVTEVAQKYRITERQVEKIIADRIKGQTRAQKKIAGKGLEAVRLAHVRAKHRRQMEAQGRARFEEYEPPAETRLKTKTPCRQVWFTVRGRAMDPIECDSAESMREIMDSLIIEGAENVCSTTGLK